MRANTRRMASALAATAMAGAAGFAPATAAGSPPATARAPIANRIVIRTTGMNYHVHGSLHPGIGAITWINADDEAHMMAVSRLKPGVTTHQVIKAMKRGGEQGIYHFMADGPEHAYGQSAMLGAGQRDTVTMAHLRPGRYLIVCFLAADGGVPHWRMGMYSSFQVHGSSRHARPSSAGTIVLRDNGIGWPEHFSGHGTYRVVDQGKRAHGLSLARLRHGTSLAAYFSHVAQQMQANQPIDGGGGLMAGGIDVLGHGQHSWVTLDLRRGRYGYVSPEDATGAGLPAQSGTFKVS